MKSELSVSIKARLLVSLIGYNFMKPKLCFLLWKVHVCYIAAYTSICKHFHIC